MTRSYAVKVLLRAVNKVNRRFYQFSVSVHDSNNEKLKITLKMVPVQKEEASSLFDDLREGWIDQGVEQGKSEGKIEVAGKMLSSGIVDIDTVVKMTDLDRAKVEELEK